MSEAGEHPYSIADVMQRKTKGPKSKNKQGKLLRSIRLRDCNVNKIQFKWPEAVELSSKILHYLLTNVNEL